MAHHHIINPIIHLIVTYPNIHLIYMSHHPSIHLAWNNINHSMPLSSCHHIPSKTEAYEHQIKIETRQIMLSPKAFKNTIVLSNLNQTMHVHCECMTYLYLPYNNSTPMALCINMWMNGLTFIKEIKTNPNLSIWKENIQTNMWNRDLKPWKHEKWSKIEVYMWKQKQKQRK